MMINDLKYITSAAKDGNPTLLVYRDGKEIPLHSKINPLKEGELTGYSLDPERFDLLVVLGCGLGYNLLKLEKENTGYSRIIVIDILNGIENEILKNPFTSFLVKKDNIRFISGRDMADIDDALSEIIDFEELKGIQVIEHPQSVRIFSSYYDEVKLIIKRLIDKKAGDKATIKAFGNLFLRNALNNISNFRNCLPVSAIYGRFGGKRAVIVSSAPSVEDNLEKLKFYGNDIYIIAVDSVLPVLRSSGIKPDFVVSIDPQARIGEHFLGHSLMDVFHIFSIVSPPELVQKYGGYISLNSHPVSQVIDDMYPGINGTIDSSTGSVAGDAYMFALMAGFEYIAMTGFDFSFSQNIIYARETAYQKRYTQYFNNRFRTAETFNGAYIFKSSGSLLVDGKYTRRAFLGYRSSLDSLISENEFKNIYIINKRGLPLKNARSVDFDSFMKFPGSAVVDKTGFLRNLKMKSLMPRYNLKNIKDRLLNETVLPEIIKESLGSEVQDYKKKKIVSLIENI